MIITPATAVRKIGLQSIIDRWAELVDSETARMEIHGLPASSDEKSVLIQLRRAEELQACLSFDDPLPFQPVENPAGIVQRARPEGAALDAGDFLRIRTIARVSRLLGGFFRSRSDNFPAVADLLKELTSSRDVEDSISAIFDDDGEIRDNASAELRRVRRDLHKTKDRLRSAVGSALKQVAARGFAADDQPTMRSGRMVIPVRVEAKRKVAGFVHDVSATGQTVYIEPTECLELNNRIRELESDEKREIEAIRRRLTDEVRDLLPQLAVNARLLVQFEVRLGVARLANELEAVVPEVNTRGVIRIKGGRNPELVLLYSGMDRPVVPLDLEIGEGFSTLVISGPNAGGKSVAMKTVGLMTAMLGLGIPVPVDSGSAFSLFDRLMVDIGDAQSVEDDLSTYTSHLLQLRAMLQEADDHTLILIDEAGTGTDPDEGAALAQAVMEEFTRRRVRTIVTTHHGSLKVFAHEASETANGSMAFDVESLKPTFRFQLHTPGSSYAAEIATRVGIDEAIVQRARSLIGEGRAHVETLISSLEARNRAMEVKLEEAHEAVTLASRERDQLASRLQALQLGKDEIRQRALDEADEILRTANAQVERVVREIRESQADRNVIKAVRAEIESSKLELKKSQRKVARRQKARTRKQESILSVSGPLTPGDRVVLDGGESIGEVISLKSDDVLVAFGSMQTRVHLDRLTKVGGATEQRVTVRQVAVSTGGAGISQVRDRIDIRGQRVDEALSTVMSMVDAAVAANLNRIEILHGKGTGALRAAINDYLSTRSDVARTEEAPWNEGGAGVTIVLLTR